MPYSEDPHHWNGFSGEKRILYGQSAHHFFFSSSTIHVSLPRLITDYEMQKYLSFQLPVIRYREILAIHGVIQDVFK